MSVSLVAVFIPILFMGGIIGRLFREFAVTLSVAIGVSLVVSLTTTPMMCALLLRKRDERRSPGRLARGIRARASTQVLRGYDALARLGAALPVADAARPLRHHRRSTSTSTRSCPRASSRSRTPGASSAQIRADQSISFQAMREKLDRVRWRSCMDGPGGGERDRLHRRRRLGSATARRCSSR